jgi:hypothetical protein
MFIETRSSATDFFYLKNRNFDSVLKSETTSNFTTEYLALIRNVLVCDRLFVSVTI